MSRIVDDVRDGFLVLLLGLDHPRPEAAAEHVVAAAVSLVEGLCIGAVEVSHPGGEVGGRRFEDEVVVISHEALHVYAPAVPPLDPAEDVEEDAAVFAVDGDWRAVVASCPDVVVGPGGEVTASTSHAFDGSPARPQIHPAGVSWHESGAAV